MTQPDNNNIILNTEHQTFLMTYVPTEEYKKIINERNNALIRNNILETNLNSLNLSVEKYIEEIRILKEEKKLLEETITELNKRIEILETEKINSNNRIEKLETIITHQEKLIKIGACIDNYKNIIKTYIYGNTKNRNDTFEIMTNTDINKTKEQQQKIDNIKNYYNKIYNSPDFKNGTIEISRHLSNIKFERNITQHPKINNEEYKELKIIFLEYCNNNWLDDSELNEKITNNIFEVLMDGELKI